MVGLQLYLLGVGAEKFPASNLAVIMSFRKRASSLSRRKGTLPKITNHTESSQLKKKIRK